MENNYLYQQAITKKQFLKDVEMAKKVVDSGFPAHFILINSSSFINVRTIGGTTLSDIKDLYGGYPIYKDYRFAVAHLDKSNNDRLTASSIIIRDLTKKDRAQLRSGFKFFPQNTYIAEMSAPDGFTVMLPFKQNPDGSTVLLEQNNLYRKTKASGTALQDVRKTWDESIWQVSERIIELFPDLMDSLLAVVNYKGVDMCIPIEKTTAKKTFRTREKEGERRAHLIHNVNQHDRKNLKNTDKVKSHLRGKSELVINGLDVALIATHEWSFRYHSETDPRMNMVRVNQ